jgi:hypothetical protein
MCETGPGQHLTQLHDSYMMMTKMCLPDLFIIGGGGGVFLLRFLTHSPTSHDITHCWLSGIGTYNVVAAVVFVVVSVGLTALYNVRGTFKF